MLKERILNLLEKTPNKKYTNAELAETVKYPEASVRRVTKELYDSDLILSTQSTPYRVYSGTPKSLGHPGSI
jgi:DNA-binding IclR family transcriptional regulator